MCGLFVSFLMVRYHRRNIFEKPAHVNTVTHGQSFQNWLVFLSSELFGNITQIERNRCEGNLR